MSNLLKVNGIPTFKGTKGFRYPEFWELYKALDRMHWTADEINMSTDIQDRAKAEPHEVHTIEGTMKLFTQHEVQVGYGYSKLLNIFKPNEVQAWLSRAQASEFTHQESYSLFTETIGLENKVYQEFLDIPVMAQKTQYLEKAKVKKYEDYKHLGLSDIDLDFQYRSDVARMLAVYGGGTELVTLMGQFAMLLAYQFQNKYNGLCQLVEYSIKDEQLHGKGNCLLFRTFIEENPDIWTDSLKFDIYEGFREIVAYESAVIDYLNPQHISADDLKQYIKYCADNALNELGMKKNWNITKNPLPFMDDVVGVTLTDFFSGSVTEYSKEVEGNWGDITYTHWSNDALSQ